jgi:hypothetical protein
VINNAREGVRMGRNERHAGQVRAANAARNAAYRRIVDAHPEEYFEYYVDECAKRSVVPRAAPNASSSKRNRIAELRAQIEAAGILDGPLPEQAPPVLIAAPDIVVPAAYTAVRNPPPPEHAIYTFEVPEMPGGMLPPPE